jgi:superfamily I DNA/RNA helicase
MILNSFRRTGARESIAIAQGRFYTATSCFKPSPEQVEVVKWMKTHNVVVSARPGAGKTATAEALAMENPELPIAVITYSKRLELDTEKRLKKYAKVDTYTFHGLAGHLFGRVIKDDIDLITERHSQTIPRIDKLPEYRFIVLDELQDLTDNLFWLTSTFIASIARTTGRHPGILALGDSRQAIYDFKGADSRFIEKAETAFHHPVSVADRDWKSLSLSHSFRLTRPTADFINNACLGGEQYIIGMGDGPKPLYFRANLGETEELLKELWPYIEGYTPDKCAILAPSVRAKTPHRHLQRLSNKLSRVGVPLSVSIFDDAPINEDVIRGKLVVSTYHQFKGTERDLVIVFGADESWFRYFGSDMPRNRCPNPVFVALTRARKQVSRHSDHSDPAESAADLLCSSSSFNPRKNCLCRSLTFPCWNPMRTSSLSTTNEPLQRLQRSHPKGPSE